MERLTQFPREGWCIDADENLGKYLSDICDDIYKSPGESGYAWNGTGYWRIDTASGKKSYRLHDLKYFFSEHYSNDEIMALANKMYPPGTIHSGSTREASKEVFHVKGPLYWKNGIIYSKGEKGAIYVTGNENPWAKIISTPEVFPIRKMRQQLAIAEKTDQATFTRTIQETNYRTKRKKKESFIKKDHWIKQTDNVIKSYNPKPNLILTKRLKKVKNKM